MAKERYRLEALLTVKRRVKDRASIALAKAIETLKKEREKEQTLIHEKDEILEKERECRVKMREEMDHGGLVFDGNVHLNFIRKLEEDQKKKEEEIEDQKEVVASAEKAVAKARRHYIDACKELQVMEKHKELWEKKIRDEITRQEEKEFDELGATIHQLRRWRGDSNDTEGALGH